jgi:hypothetical protein
VRTNEALQELSKFERDEIQLQERKKHMGTEIKKRAKVRG